MKHARRFFKLWVIFFGMTIAIEAIGGRWLSLWFYPRLGGLAYLFHVLIIGYPFTGFFALELFVWLQSFSWVKKTQPALPIVAFAFAYLNEYPNTFAYEWRYASWPVGEFLNIPILVPFLWVSLLFVVLFKDWFTTRTVHMALSSSLIFTAIPDDGPTGSNSTCLVSSAVLPVAEEIGEIGSAVLQKFAPITERKVQVPFVLEREKRVFGSST